MMFGIGFGEVVVIFIILIIFIRPKDLPNFLRSAGRLYGKARKMYNEVIQIKDQILKEIDEAASLETPSTSSPQTPAKSTSAKIAEALPKPKPKPPSITDTTVENTNDPPPEKPEIKEDSSLTEPPKDSKDSALS